MAAIRGLSLKQVSKVKVSFCPYDPKTATIREFLRRVSSKKMLDTNNKCQVVSEVKNDRSEPQIEVVFTDKDTMNMRTADMKLMEILARFNIKCRAKEP